MKKFLTLSLKIIIVLIISLVIVEGGAGLLLKNKYYAEGSNLQVLGEYIEIKDDPNIVAQETQKKKDSNGNLVVDEVYNIDKYGNRYIKEFLYSNKNPSQHLFLFGGSYTYGEDLSDKDTLDYNINEKTKGKVDVVNFSRRGAGPNLMLKTLQDGIPEELVANNSGDAIYIYHGNHIRRVIGDMQILEWSDNMPYYYLENEELKYGGTFAEGDSARVNLYSNLRKLNTFKYFDINLPFPSDQDVVLTFKVIEEMRNVYESQFDGDFHVLIHPLGGFQDEQSQALIEMLKQNNIDVIEFDSFDGEDIKNYSPSWHPSKEFNEEFSQKIVEALNL